MEQSPLRLIRRCSEHIPIEKINQMLLVYEVYTFYIKNDIKNSHENMRMTYSMSE